MKRCKYCDKPFEEHSQENRFDPNIWVETEEVEGGEGNADDLHKAPGDNEWDHALLHLRLVQEGC